MSIKSNTDRPNLPPSTAAGWSPDEFAQRWGVSRATVYKELALGDLDSVKVGKRRIIPATAEAPWLEAKRGKEPWYRADDEGGRKS